VRSKERGSIANGFLLSGESVKSLKRKARSKPKAGDRIRKTWPDIYWPVEWISLKEAKKRFPAKPR
jgi:hypothetical protein